MVSQTMACFAFQPVSFVVLQLMYFFAVKICESCEIERGSLEFVLHKIAFRRGVGDIDIISFGAPRKESRDFLCGRSLPDVM